MMRRFQFSLRSVFVLVTVLAAAIATAANQPGAALLFGFVGLPFIMATVMSWLLRAPRLARLLAATCCAGLFVASGILFILANEAHAMGASVWFGLLAMWGYGFLFAWVAWLLPDRPPS